MNKKGFIVSVQLSSIMGESIKPDKVLDCIGLYCPMPIFNTREAIDSLKIGQVLKVLADDPAAEEDIKRWAKNAGHEVLSCTREDDSVCFLIRKVRD